MNDEPTQSPARTDDLLASGAESKDGARGFENNPTAAPLKTGMEGIGDTAGGGDRQADTQDATPQPDTFADNPDQLPNKQGR